ncbi:MAG: 16S rRNA (adenine(1518)-N(6)/adenine(1519)-N(6))-dimethyltransferase RsmA [Verrucomicrobiota bacterium]
MTLHEMRQLLDERDIRLTKSLGQNFLHDGNQLRRIVAAADLTAADQVLEIGPGLGPLTELLLASAAQVLAIEKDHRLVEFLRERFGDASKLTLIHADALDYLRDAAHNWSAWKLVANLPYSVASPILVELAMSPHPPTLMVATLQEEVVQRLIADAGSSDYGVLTLLIQLHYEPRGCFRIPSSCFFPAPEVDSACVKLARRAEPLLERALVPVFEKLVKRGFSQRRKMMMKLLKQDWAGERLHAAFEQLGLSPQIRAEAVSLEQFVQLTRALAR